MTQSENLVDLIDLHIPATIETPEVRCSKEFGEIVMTGNLIPSDPKSFFAPILRWFKAYTIEYEPATIVVHFYLTFVNGCSEHYLGTLLKRLEELYSKGLNVEILCHYESDDTDMRDWGKDLKQIVKLPIELLEIN
ncbi:MAG: DUF1987 domain-containing protein [Bacteroidales bacterium]